MGRTYDDGTTYMHTLRGRGCTLRSHPSTSEGAKDKSKDEHWFIFTRSLSLSREILNPTTGSEQSQTCDTWNEKSVIPVNVDSFETLCLPCALIHGTLCCIDTVSKPNWWASCSWFVVCMWQQLTWAWPVFLLVAGINTPSPWQTGLSCCRMGATVMSAAAWKPWSSRIGPLDYAIVPLLCVNWLSFFRMWQYG